MGIWLKSISAGFASVLIVLLLALAWLIYKISRIPHPPNATVGFSPIQLLSHPPILAAIALVFLTGFGFAQFYLRR